MRYKIKKFIADRERKPVMSEGKMREGFEIIDVEGMQKRFLNWINHHEFEFIQVVKWEIDLILVLYKKK